MLIRPGSLRVPGIVASRGKYSKTDGILTLTLMKGAVCSLPPPPPRDLFVNVNAIVGGWMNRPRKRSHIPACEQSEKRERLAKVIKHFMFTSALEIARNA